MSQFIKDTNVFEEASHFVSKVFYDKQRLPNQVFRVPFQKTAVLDFDYAMSYHFWDELKRLIDTFGDSYVIMAVLDPHPVDYYYNEFSRYNWCTLNKGTTADEYWNMLNESPIDSPADSIVSNSEVVVWLSSSMKWAIWGERSYGICVAGFSDEIKDYNKELWFTMDEAITNLVSLQFKNCIVPEEITSKLMKFYT